MTTTVFAQTVGKVILVIGNVVVIRGGVELPLNRNDGLQSGDVIKTMQLSNAQIRMNDESLIALRPGTEFKIDEFRYDGKQDGSERGFFSLIKGGLRTVTGAVGKANRENYKVTTPSATIGIRGTHYTLVHCQDDCESGATGVKLASLDIAQSDAAPPAAIGNGRIQNGTYGGVQEGRIALTNDSKVLNQFGAGDFFFVSDSKSPPQRLIAPPEFLRDRLESRSRSEQKAPQQQGDTAQANIGSGNSGGNNLSQPTAPPTMTNSFVAKLETEYRVTEDKNSFSNPVAAAENTPLKGDGFYPAGSNLFFMAAEYNSVGNYHNAIDQDIGYAITADPSGLTTALRVSANTGFYLNSAKSKEGGADGGVIAWVRWTDGTPYLFGWGDQPLTVNQGFHMIIASPSTSLPSQNSVYFNLLGATQPTETRAGAQGGWNVTSGTIVANFLSSSLIGNLGLSLSRPGEAGNFAMTFSGTATTGFNSVNANVSRTEGTAALCVSSCTGSGTLRFAGPNASHAGMVYEFNAGAYFVQGAAVFKQGGTTTTPGRTPTLGTSPGLTY